LPAELTKAAPPATGDGKMDFNFFPDENKDAKDPSFVQTDSAEVAAKAARRRWMLKVHQTLGITTWALMAATVTVGQLNYNQLYGGGGGSTKYQGPHALLVASTTLSFAATGAFAIFAPDPYDKPLKLDTGLVHRIAVIGATAGMVTEAILGIVTSRRADAGNPRSLKTLARAHQIVGYSTFGMLTVAGTVWVF
jgi:cytochrome b561